MLELIVLGQIPGTDIYISFNDYMLAAGSLLVSTLLISYGNRAFHRARASFVSESEITANQLQTEA